MLELGSWTIPGEGSAQSEVLTLSHPTIPYSHMYLGQYSSFLKDNNKQHLLMSNRKYFEEPLHIYNKEI